MSEELVVCNKNHRKGVNLMEYYTTIVKDLHKVLHSLIYYE